ncbi:XRE family transcriptional regulator [Chitinimonas sp.]|uniref:XRE family transcriptional regulator n=1 Tax=Chitinimonas sp. TaxID=1934313 RepID=UPI0035B0406F
MSSPAYANERWYQLLKESASRLGVRGTARELEYSNHTGTVQVLNGNYSASIDRFAQRVLAKLDRVTCPHLERPLAQSDCRNFAYHPNPTSSTAAAAHWRACQACPLKPQQGDAA